jgi:hypothetical protein
LFCNPSGDVSPSALRICSVLVSTNTYSGSGLRASSTGAKEYFVSIATLPGMSTRESQRCMAGAVAGMLSSSATRRSSSTTRPAKRGSSKSRLVCVALQTQLPHHAALVRMTSSLGCAAHGSK